MTKFRQWLHERGVHRLCRSTRVVDRVEHGFEGYIATVDGEVVDVTNHGGPRTIYKTLHR